MSIRDKKEEDLDDGQVKVPIPVALPGILKDYAKTVLRERPEDIIKWSAKYFNDISRRPHGSTGPSDKQCLDTIQQQLHELHKNNNGRLIDQNGCKALYSEFSAFERVPVDALTKSWLSHGYSSTQLRELLSLGQMFATAVDRDFFFILVCKTFESTLREAFGCFLKLTSIHGTAPRTIPYAKLERVCNFLMEVDGGDQAGADLRHILEDCRQLSSRQNSMITSENLIKQLQPN